MNMFNNFLDVWPFEKGVFVVQVSVPLPHPEKGVSPPKKGGLV